MGALRNNSEHWMDKDKMRGDKMGFSTLVLTSASHTHNNKNKDQVGFLYLLM